MSLLAALALGTLGLAGVSSASPSRKSGTLHGVNVMLLGVTWVLGDVQFLPGYCVLLTDSPGVQRLTDLPRDRRTRFLADMELLGEAVERVCSRRARYEWEPERLVGRPAWLYPAEYWSDPAAALGPHDYLRAELVAEFEAIRRSGGRSTGSTT